MKKIYFLIIIAFYFNLPNVIGQQSITPFNGYYKKEDYNNNIIINHLLPSIKQPLFDYDLLFPEYSQFVSHFDKMEYLTLNLAKNTPKTKERRYIIYKAHFYPNGYLQKIKYYNKCGHDIIFKNNSPTEMLLSYKYSNNYKTIKAVFECNGRIATLVYYFSNKNILDSVWISGEKTSDSLYSMLIKYEYYNKQLKEITIVNRSNNNQESITATLDYKGDAVLLFFTKQDGNLTHKDMLYSLVEFERYKDTFYLNNSFHFPSEDTYSLAKDIFRNLYKIFPLIEFPTYTFKIIFHKNKVNTILSSILSKSAFYDPLGREMDLLKVKYDIKNRYIKLVYEQHKGWQLGTYVTGSEERGAYIKYHRKYYKLKKI